MWSPPLARDIPYIPSSGRHRGPPCWRCPRGGGGASFLPEASKKKPRAPTNLESGSSTLEDR
eukprot:3978426-Pyramimonas_sp.AAC.1